MPLSQAKKAGILWAAQHINASSHPDHEAAYADALKHLSIRHEVEIAALMQEFDAEDGSDDDDVRMIDPATDDGGDSAEFVAGARLVSSCILDDYRILRADLDAAIEQLA